MSSDSEVRDVERDERGGMAGDGFFWELVRRSTGSDQYSDEYKVTIGLTSGSFWAGVLDLHWDR
jgi:hypothetical protein